jgi:hypothetical protein
MYWSSVNNLFLIVSIISRSLALMIYGTSIINNTININDISQLRDINSNILNLNYLTLTYQFKQTHKYNVIVINSNANSC